MKVVRPFNNKKKLCSVFLNKAWKKILLHRVSKKEIKYFIKLYWDMYIITIFSELENFEVT